MSLYTACDHKAQVHYTPRSIVEQDPTVDIGVWALELYTGWMYSMSFYVTNGTVGLKAAISPHSSPRYIIQGLVIGSAGISLSCLI